MVIKTPDEEELDLDKMTMKELKNQELRFSNYIWQEDDIIEGIKRRLEKQEIGSPDYDETLEDLRKEEKYRLGYAEVLEKIREKIKEKGKEESEKTDKR